MSSDTAVLAGDSESAIKLPTTPADAATTNGSSKDNKESKESPTLAGKKRKRDSDASDTDSSDDDDDRRRSSRSSKRRRRSRSRSPSSSSSSGDESSSDSEDDRRRRRRSHSRERRDRDRERSSYGSHRGRHDSRDRDRDRRDRYYDDRRDRGRYDDHRRDRDRDRNREQIVSESQSGRERSRLESTIVAPASSSSKILDTSATTTTTTMSSSSSSSDVAPARTAAASASRTGGVYIPPFKLALLLKNVTDKSSAEYQRMTWDALKKSINGLINKVNVSNIANILPELFAENLIRGRGLLCRSLMKAQAASPTFTHVYAALVAVLNTKMPQIGELLLHRLIVQFRRAFTRNDKPVLLASTRFVAHLVNQQVAGEIIALQVLALLLEKPTDDSVEVAVGFVQECGYVLQDLSPQGFAGLFERFRGILHEGEIDKRVQYMIERLFAVRKSNFSEFPGVFPALDLVEADDQITHDDLSLDDEIDVQDTLNYFNFDPQYLENEERYQEIKREILGEDYESDDDNDAEDDDQVGSDQEDAHNNHAPVPIDLDDQTDVDLITLRRTIYLAIMSSLDFEECAHKLRKLNLSSHEDELCKMVLECASQERTYMRFYGLLAQRFCMLERAYQDAFVESFCEQYSTIHRLETNKLRNVAKLFAHLLHSDALPWNVLRFIHLNEEETTSSSRIFIKILFQEMAEFLGLAKLNERLRDPFMAKEFEGLFPKDNPKNTRFAINFFTSIGLGGLTDDLREHLRNAPKLIMQQQAAAAAAAADSDSDSDSDSSSSDSDSDSDTSSSDSDSDIDSSSGSESDSSASSSSSEESDSDRRKKRRRSPVRETKSAPRETKAASARETKPPLDQETPRREDRGREDRGREDRGREDRGREDRGREDRGREDRGREDRGREDRGREDRGREDRGREDRGREDRGREDRDRDRDRGREDRRRDRD